MYGMHEILCVVLFYYGSNSGIVLDIFTDIEITNDVYGATSTELVSSFPSNT